MESGLNGLKTNEDFGIKIVESKDLIPEIMERSSPEITTSKSDSRSKTFPMPTEYTEALLPGLKYESFIKFLGNLKDQVLVDIGAGQTPNGYYIATQAGARAYIGVESYNFEGLKENFDKGKKYIAKEAKEGDHPLIPLALEREDMLAYLKRLPDHSVSILASGLDDFILVDEQYRYELQEEIARVLHKDGAFINYDSALYPEGDGINFERLEGDDNPFMRVPSKYTFDKNPEKK